MKRREFIVQSGTFVTAAVLFPTALLQASELDDSLIGTRRPDPNNFTQGILKAISIGMNAPNPHNTQAWKFKITSDDEALFYVDETRLLIATDPPARQMHIGCGCFLETLRLGASSIGLLAEIEYLPEGSYSFEEIGVKPVARIKVSPAPRLKELPLSEAIYSRQTNRSFYEEGLISTDDFNSIIAKIVPAHTQITCENSPDRLANLIDILYEGMVIEAHTYETYDESRIWFRSSQKQIETKRDGINLRTDGTKGIMLSLMEFIIDEDNPQSWHRESALKAFLKTYRKKVDTAGGVILFTSKTNTLLDWIKTGTDYVRFQLAADSLGFVIHPMSQVLQEYPEMNELQERYNNFLKIEAPAKIQMSVRIGRGKKLYYSYRRDLDDLLT